MKKNNDPKSRPRFRGPAWILPLFTAVFSELMLHLWTVERFAFHRFCAVALFALALGAVLALICSLFPARASKWAAGILSGLVAAVCLAQLMIEDMFQVFMAVETVRAGAAGVVQDYMPLVLSQIGRHIPHILLLAAPIAAFCVLVRPTQSIWFDRCFLGGGAVAACLAAVLLVNALGADASRLREQYHFDSAVRCFGLHTAFALDVLNSSQITREELEFNDVPTQPSSESTEPASTHPTEIDPVQESEAPTEPPVVYNPHTLGIDFAALAQSESDGDIAALHSYIAGQAPAMENQYTGLFEGKNLIFITAEAFSGAVIDPKLTPTLYRLASRGIRFTDYYQPTWGASTTGGEYSNLLSLVPKGGSCMKEARQQEFFLTIGAQLQRRGYHSAAFHNNSYTYYDRDQTHVRLGYDYFMGYGNGMERGVTKNWPQSDLEMMDYSVGLYIDQQPFSVYYMTVSGHCEYNRDNDMAAKNFSRVQNMDLSYAVRYYIATQLELEAALKSLLKQLEEAGILNDTVIVLATDHYPYGLDTRGDGYLKELYETDTINDFTRDQNTLIIWSGCIEGMNLVVDEPVMSLDILPTLSNLFGVPYDSRLMVGRDVFSDTEPLVFWSISGSWKTDKGCYDGTTEVFTPAEGVEVEDGYVDYINAIVSNKLKYSRAVAEHNYFNYVFRALPAE